MVWKSLSLHYRRVDFFSLLGISPVAPYFSWFVQGDPCHRKTPKELGRVVSVPNPTSLCPWKHDKIRWKFIGFTVKGPGGRVQETPGVLSSSPKTSIADTIPTRRRLVCARWHELGVDLSVGLNHSCTTPLLPPLLRYSFPNSTSLGRSFKGTFTRTVSPGNFRTTTSPL